MSVYKQLVVAVIIAIPFSIVNFNGYLMGGFPNGLQVFVSLFFIFLWFLYGLICGVRKYTEFVKITSVYWMTGVVMLALGYYIPLGFLYIVAGIIFPGPVYGLSAFYFEHYGIELVILNVSITYGVSLVGYLIGRMLFVWNFKRSY